MRKSIVLVLAVLASLLLPTGQLFAAASASEDGHGAHESDTIAWFRGDVDKAFAMAREQNKPLFLYWGAVWCPPCVQIKNTVFKSRQFIALSELFVPFYLDGDTEEAQATGERFGVKGYPTMIVFNPAGEEITRIPGGIDIDRYNSVLRQSLNSLRPTKKLLEEAMAGSDELSAEDYTQLAYYSWGQDFDVLPADSEPSLFRKLADQARPHDEIASARLFMQYLVDSSDANSEESPVRVEGALGRLKEILGSDELVVACWDSLAYYPEVVKILAEDDAAKQELIELWQGRLMDLRHSPALSVEEQLGGWIPLLYFHFEASEDPLPEALVSQLVEDVNAADRQVTVAFARQSLANQIKWVYQYAHLYDRARDFLLAELDRSKSPYYFMSSLGSLAEKQGHNDEAVDWYRKAYETSQGSATRFQWGGSYVRALIRLKPDADELILSTAESLFDELPSNDDVFSGRNFRVLRAVKEQLAAWKAEEKGEAVAQRFVSRIASMCKAETEGSVEKKNCQSLLEEESAT